MESEEEKKKKLLYVFFSHGNSCYNAHTLYALDLPRPEDPTPTIPKLTTTTTVTTADGTIVSSTTSVAQGEPDRKSINPVLRFRARYWPRMMTCARLDKKLYFLGGTAGCGKETVTYPRDVSVLDLSSSTNAVKFSDQPRSAMPIGPPMLQGKLNPVISFSADGNIFVLSGCNECMLTGKKFKQFEILSDNKWKYGADPPFNDLIELSRYVIVKDKVIIIGSTWNTYDVWEYDLKLNKWIEFDKRCWTGVDEYTCFQFGQGSQMIGDTLWTMGDHSTTGMPIVFPIKYHKNDEEEEMNGKCLNGKCVNGKNSTLEDTEKKNGTDLSLEEMRGKGLSLEYKEEDLPSVQEHKFFEVVPYSIESRRVSDTLTRVGDRTLCFVQVGAPRPSSGDKDGFNKEKCYMSVTQFAVDGDSAQHLNSAHYEMVPDRAFFNVVAAYLV